MKPCTPDFSWNSSIQVVDSKEYGASKLLLTFARNLKLDQLIFSSKNSQKKQWREDVLAMIIGKLIFSLNELSLINFHSDTVLWECCGHSPLKKPDVHKNTHQPLMKLLSRQESIQKKLIDKHLKEREAILYDLTDWKLSLDPLEQHAGLLTNVEGCPVAIEFFPAHCEMSMQNQIDLLVDKYELNSLIIISDFQMFAGEAKRIVSLTQSQMYNSMATVENELISPQLYEKIYKQLMQVKKSFQYIREGESLYRNCLASARLVMTMLSFYLEWHMDLTLDSYFQKKTKSVDHPWGIPSVIERLKSIRSQTVKVGEITFSEVISDLDQEQKEIIAAFGTLKL